MPGDQRGWTQRANWIPFQNGYSGEIPAFSLVKVTGFASSDDGRPGLAATRPDDTLSRLYAIVSDQNVAQGGWGLCTTEIAFTLYDGSAPAFSEGWGPQVDSFLAAKNQPAALTALSGNVSSKTIALMRPEPINVIIGKLAGSLSQGSSATVNVWSGAAGSEAVMTGVSVTAYDFLMKSGSTAIASGTWVKVEWINGNWYVTQASCA